LGDDHLAGALLEGDWAEIAQGGVPPPPVVEHLDVLEQRGHRLAAGPVGTLAGELRLQRAEEALHRRIVVAVSGTTHADLEAAARELLLVLPASVLTAAAEMVQDAGTWSPLGHGPTQSLERQLPGQPIAGRPA